MHILRMILEHLVVCKVVDFALHQFCLAVKKAFDLVVTLLFLWLFGAILKEADRICRGLGFVLLLIAAGFLSGASFWPDQKSIAA
jgi:hypothetical protein